MIFEISMYYLSCLPLWVSVFFIDVVSLKRGAEHGWTEIISVAVLPLVTVMCIVYIFLWIKRGKKTAKEEYIIHKAKEERFAAVEFMMSYVFPLFAFEFTQWDGVVLFLIFFGCFGILVHKHRIYCTNLPMEMIGYRTFECELIPEIYAAEDPENLDKHVIKKQVVSQHALGGSPGFIIKTKIINADYQFETDYIDPESKA